MSDLVPTVPVYLTLGTHLEKSISSWAGIWLLALVDNPFTL